MSKGELTMNTAKVEPVSTPSAKTTGFSKIRNSARSWWDLILDPSLLHVILLV